MEEDPNKYVMASHPILKDGRVVFSDGIFELDITEAIFHIIVERIPNMPRNYLSRVERYLASPEFQLTIDSRIPGSSVVYYPPEPPDPMKPEEALKQIMKIPVSSAGAQRAHQIADEALKAIKPKPKPAFVRALPPKNDDNTNQGSGTED